MEFYVDLRIDDAEAFDDKLVFEWTVVKSHNGQFTMTDLRSVYMYENMDKALEKLGTKVRELPNFKGRVVRARVYKDREGTWKVAPESIKLPIASSVLTPKQASAIAPAPAPAPAPKQKATDEQQEAIALVANYLNLALKKLKKADTSKFVPQTTVNAIRDLHVKFVELHGDLIK